MQIRDATYGVQRHSHEFDDLRMTGTISSDAVLVIGELLRNTYSSIFIKRSLKAFQIREFDVSKTLRFVLSVADDFDTLRLPKKSLKLKTHHEHPETTYGPHVD